MYVKNSVTIEFATDRPLTDAEIDTLQGILGLQIEEPQDFQGNEEKWIATEIRIYHNAIKREGK